MDYLKLSYALYASYSLKEKHNQPLLSYTEYLEKLFQALVQDEEAMTHLSNVIHTQYSKPETILTKINF